MANPPCTSTSGGTGSLADLVVNATQSYTSWNPGPEALIELIRVRGRSSLSYRDLPAHGRLLAWARAICALQAAILQGGPVIPARVGCGRFALLNRWRAGKSGSYRICYACFLVTASWFWPWFTTKASRPTLRRRSGKPSRLPFEVIGEKLKGEVR